MRSLTLIFLAAGLVLAGCSARHYQSQAKQMLIKGIENSNSHIEYFANAYMENRAEKLNAEFPDTLSALVNKIHAMWTATDDFVAVAKEMAKKDYSANHINRLQAEYEKSIELLYQNAADTIVAAGYFGEKRIFSNDSAFYEAQIKLMLNNLYFCRHKILKKLISDIRPELWEQPNYAFRNVICYNVEIADSSELRVALCNNEMQPKYNCEIQILGISQCDRQIFVDYKIKQKQLPGMLLFPEIAPGEYEIEGKALIHCDQQNETQVLFKQKFVVPDPATELKQNE